MVTLSKSSGKHLGIFYSMCRNSRPTTINPMIIYYEKITNSAMLKLRYPSAELPGTIWMTLTQSRPHFGENTIALIAFKNIPVSS